MPIDYLSNKALGGVVYGQYTTAKGYSYARRNAEYTTNPPGALLLL
jgi:hypothetical protein